MKPTLNQEDVKLLKSIFATKDDLVAMEKRQDAKYVTKDDLKNELKRTEKRIIKRMDLVDNFIDRDLMKLAKDVDLIKIHVGLPM